ncbi:isocitrate lyase/PEP mutase family protein [Alteromonas oceanisediminis]|uniref:isocitrate lyase/PEP mutase family protein n=1 Tax=Alteromonas oceanisediminis TaxID=2836180 RepID=UPI001BDB5208|nr:isocitrate lyase/phosphoenolpyruvate mutase family protein [Alteromonas oceanisediminis]MBT0586154.1 isocitrate lyase/PEP mutase family protein [Alteromonas oceanisediminis]
MNKTELFMSLHYQEDILFLPNAWDVISAIAIEKASFKALGTTSYGLANAHGMEDGENIAFELLLESVRRIIGAVSIPVSVDIEAGYASRTDDIAQNVLSIAEIGAVGINIEDSRKDKVGLRAVEEQADIIRAVRKQLVDNGFETFFINARIDTVFQGRPTEETLTRASKYIEAGANGVFVPGLSESGEIKILTSELDAPVNIMSLTNLTSLQDLQALGIKRFSMGNAFSDAVISHVEKTATLMFNDNSTKALYP